MKALKRTAIERYLCVVAAMLLTWSGGFSTFADYSSTVLSKNPEAFWQLNETNPVPQMATATNSVASSPDGIYRNGATTISSPIAGAAGETAVKFDGVSQYIEVPYNASVNPSSALTVEAWVRPSATVGWDDSWYRSIVTSAGPPWGGGYQLMYNSTVAGDDRGLFKLALYNGSARAEVFDGNLMGSGGFNIYATNDIWYYVVGTWSSSDNIGHLYVNGVELASGSIAYSATTNGPLRIGADDGVQGGPGPDPVGAHMNPGGTAQVAIYDTELSQAQILAHYEAGTNAAADYAATVMADHPVAYWKLDESSFPTQPVVANEGTAGSALDGVYCYASTPGVAGAAPPHYAGLPATNTAVYLTNSATGEGEGLGDGGYVLFPPLRTTNDPTEMTVVALVKRDGTQMANACVLGRRLNNYEKSYVGFVANNNLGCEWDDNSPEYSWNSGLVPPDGVWTLAAWVFTDTNAIIYMDTGTGLVSATNDYAASYGTNDFTRIPTAFTHQVFSGTTGGNYDGRRYNGAVDEVAVWTNSLSRQDILDLREAWVSSTNLWLVTQPVPRPVMLGGVAKFSCIAAGSTNYMPFTYQVFKDGAPVGSPSTTAPTYSNVQLADLSSTFTVNVLTNGVASAFVSDPVSLIRWTTPGSYSALVESLKPAAYYRFSQASGTTVYDIASALDGSLGGSATRTNGPAPTAQVGFLSNNNAINISTTAAGYASVEGPAIDPQTNTVTITLWFYPTSASQSAFSGLYYSRGLGTNANNYVGLQIDRSGGEQLSFAWSGAPNPYDWHTGIYVLPGEWNFIAVVVNQTNAAMYDYTASVGWQQATINQTFPPPVGLAVGGVTAIGADPNFLTSRYCKGAFDEVAVFNKALSQDEIYKLASAGFNVNLSILPIDSSHNQVGWSYGTLQSAASILGPWTAVPGATIPSYTNTISGDQKYFRAAY